MFSFPFALHPALSILKSQNQIVLQIVFPSSFREILLNYAISHPHTGYMQGMSDLLAPILAEVRNEVDAYWCFEGLMQKTIFVSSPKDTDMDRQLVRDRHTENSQPNENVRKVHRGKWERKGKRMYKKVGRKKEKIEKGTDA